MPKNKNAYARYIIIDQYLRRFPFVKTSKLKQVISERLSTNISSRTIQNDIQNLINDSALGIYAPIEYSKSKQAYYYPEDVEEVFPAIELDENEINALMFYGKIQNQYKNLGIFEDIIEAIEKVIESSNIKGDYKNIFFKEPLILPEESQPLKGSEQIIKIIQALKQKRKIKFKYQKYDSDENKERIISPYFLKEDKHMWYIIGIEENMDVVRIFAVDRISYIRIVNEPIDEFEFDPQEHFKYSFGITAPDKKPNNITLSFSKLTGNYVKALPIHGTQEVLIDDDEELRIRVKVIPTYEFYSKILSYGPDVEVISPKSVVNKIKQRLQEALKKY